VLGKKTNELSLVKIYSNHNRECFNGFLNNFGCRRERLWYRQRLPGKLQVPEYSAVYGRVAEPQKVVACFRIIPKKRSFAV
jgi:hypothetical protein